METTHLRILGGLMFKRRKWYCPTCGHETSMFPITDPPEWFKSAFEDWEDNDGKQAILDWFDNGPNLRLKTHAKLVPEWYDCESCGHDWHFKGFPVKRFTPPKFSDRSD
ncbi:MAG: hypothetical protein QF596_07845 [Acidimicrobiales bacterium]|nr:hypothetical protein [Acidimicrobiales bacterium]HJM29118.1 hypothetical protein [Acidimicrobiales bacterium]HJM97434.1 hypothetical protein [Acidimicrobiales bacterium]